MNWKIKTGNFFLMQILDINKTFKEGKVILSAEIKSDCQNEPQTLFFCYPEKFGAYLPLNADPFFPVMLIPSMLYGEDLEILPELSAGLYNNQSVIQDIFKSWYPGKLKKIKVNAENFYRPPENLPEKNATFFSLGVDSMYTLLKHLPENNPYPGKELNSLIYIKGLELPLSTYSKGQDKDVILAIDRLARHYGLELVTGETNIRDVFPLDFVKLFLGPSLASCALSLSDGFKNIFVPSHYSYADLFHVSSHPMIDGLWSNEKTRIIHDGSEKERAYKIADLIAYDDYALDNLRVCVCNEGGNYNCCRCWKCIRTMLTLEIIGRLENSGAFKLPLPHNYSTELKSYSHDSMVYVKENWKLAKNFGRKDLEKRLYIEIRVGSLDIFRDQKSYAYLFKEIIHYILIKLGRKLSIKSI